MHIVFVPARCTNSHATPTLGMAAAAPPASMAAVRQRAANRKSTDFAPAVMASLERVVSLPVERTSMPPMLFPHSRWKRHVPIHRDMRDSPASAMATRMIHQSLNKSARCSINTVVVSRLPSRRQGEGTEPGSCPGPHRQLAVLPPRLSLSPCQLPATERAVLDPICLLLDDPPPLHPFPPRRRSGPPTASGSSPGRHLGRSRCGRGRRSTLSRCGRAAPGRFA